jgi:hypothetical protein
VHQPSHCIVRAQPSRPGRRLARTRRGYTADAGLAGIDNHVEDVLAAAVVIGESVAGHSMGAIVSRLALVPLPLSGLRGSTHRLALIALNIK